MATQVQFRGGSSTEHNSFTGAAREVTVDTTKDTVVVHDGSTTGGHPLQKQYPALGSVSAPTYTFVGDTNTGIYSPGADQVAISTNGTGRLFVDASGNVGIGTSSITGAAGTRLQIESAGSTRLNISANAASYAAIDFGDSGDRDIGRIEYYNANNAMLFWTNASERLRIDSSGRLLVNNTAATQSHSLQVTASSDGNAVVVNGRASDDIGELSFYENDRSTKLGEIQYRQDQVNIRHRVGDIRFATGGTTERMRIDSSGRVGIGTTSPGSRLHVRTPDSTASTTEVSTIVRDNSGYFLKLSREASSGNTGGLIGADSVGTYYTGGHNTQNMLYIQAAYGVMSFYTNNAERLRIDSSGRLLVGTSSSSDNISLALAGNSGGSTADSKLLLVYEGSVPGNGDTLSSISFGDNSHQSSSSKYAAEIKAQRDGGTWTSGTSMPGRLVFATTADGASSPTERVRISRTGDVYLRQAGGSERVYFTSAGAASIGPASYAAASTTLYIGNAAIQVSSDVRLKDNIEDTALDALDAISKIKVKDFTWNDPSDTSFNNRNARGKWTGLIAQELVEVLPFVVNAPRKEEDGSIDYESEERWLLDQSQLCPVLIKAIQQQQEIIAGLEARIAALEA